MATPSVSSIVEFLPALKAALDARGGLSGVVVSTGPLPLLSNAQESIEFGGGQFTFEWGKLGNRERKEDYTIDSWIFAQVWGVDEAAITFARNRAFAILSEFNECLLEDPTVGGNVMTAELKNATYTPVITGETGNARGATINFEIEVKARLRR